MVEGRVHGSTLWKNENKDAFQKDQDQEGLGFSSPFAEMSSGWERIAALSLISHLWEYGAWKELGPMMCTSMRGTHTHTQEMHIQELHYSQHRSTEPGAPLQFPPPPARSCRWAPWKHRSPCTATERWAGIVNGAPHFRINFVTGKSLKKLLTRNIIFRHRTE